MRSGRIPAQQGARANALTGPAIPYDGIPLHRSFSSEKGRWCARAPGSSLTFGKNMNTRIVWILAMLVAHIASAADSPLSFTVDAALKEARVALAAAGLRETEFPVDRVWRGHVPGRPAQHWFVSFYSSEKGCFLFAIGADHIRRQFPVHRFQIERPYGDAVFTEAFIALLKRTDFERTSIPWGIPKGWEKMKAPNKAPEPTP